ncbi:MAG: hypothetical protein H7201_08050 [Candidatus Saccharibacteria bacterium]|nr:hypothetical protein [Microbacteriaceae bacterium]
MDFGRPGELYSDCPADPLSMEEKSETVTLPLLTAAETAAFEFHLAHPHTRLKQERLPWAAVEAALS